MDESNLTIGQFFRVVYSRQAYLNLLYLLAAFPLGVLYFIYLVTGLSLGISLSIIWVGIPLLWLVGVGWWALARFERYMAVHLLDEDVPAMILPSNQEDNLWYRFKEHFAHPVTWKSLLYLFVKFPLGMATFVILVTVVSLTLAFLSMPFTYKTVQFFQDVSFGSGLPVWQIDSFGDALLGLLIGLILWPLTLQITNKLTWIHSKFAKAMLSIDPKGRNMLATEIKQ